MAKRLKSVAILFLFAFAFSSKASAQDCTSHVVDEAGVLGSSFSLVQKSVQSLRDAGADAYVRIYSSVDTAEQERRMLRICPNWTNPDTGNKKGNLIAHLVSINTRRDVYMLGQMWSNQYVERMIRSDINSRIKIPQFRARNYAQGIAMAMDAITAAARQQLAPQAAPTPQPQQAPVEAPRTVVVERQTQPTDFSGLWTVMKIAVIAAGLGAAIWFLTAIVRSNRKRQTERIRAKSLQAKCANLVNNNASAITTLKALYDACINNATQHEAQGFKAHYDQLAREHRSAATQFETLINSHSTADGQSTETYARVAEEYDASFVQLAAVDDMIGALQKDLEHFERKVATLDQAMLNARTEVERAGNEIAGAERKGFKADALKAKLQGAQNELADAETFVDSCPSEAVDKANKSRNAAAAVIREATALPRLKQDTLDRINVAKIQAHEAETLIRETRVVFDRIAANNAPKAYESLLHNGGRAQKKLAEANELIAQAAEAASDERQEWAQADQYNASAMEEIDRIGSLMQSITELDKNLGMAREESRNALNQANADLIKSRDHIKMCEADMRVDDSLKSKLQAAEGLIKQTEEELSTSKPDYFEAMKVATVAINMIEEVARSSRSSHEQFTLTKQKAERAIKAAQARVSKAREYQADHRRYVKTADRQRLSEAERSLSEALSTTDVDAILAYAMMADDYGKTAYKSVHTRVEDDTVHIPSPQSYSPPSVSSDWSNRTSDAGSAVSSFVDSVADVGSSISSGWD